MNIRQPKSALVVKKTAVDLYSKVRRLAVKSARLDVGFAAVGIDVGQRGYECASLRMLAKPSSTTWI